MERIDLEELRRLELPGGTTRAPFVAIAEIGNAHDRNSLLDPIAEALDFPDYYGRNWDAFSECIRDLSWIPEVDVILVLGGLSAASGRIPELVALLVDVLENAIREHAQFQLTLQVFELDGSGQGPHTDLEPIDGLPEVHHFPWNK